MDKSAAEFNIVRIRDGNSVAVHFLCPIFSTMLAAETLRGKCEAWSGRVEFKSAGTYAETIGLKDVLKGNYKTPKRGGLKGSTYSPLVKLSSHVEVEFCNEIIGDLIHEQLGQISPQYATQLAKIVGELHDNIPSHADGAGFSAAQVYDVGDRKKVSFAIADAGCGMLRNVKKAAPGVNTDTDAVSWCLIRGNTSAKTNDPFAQRLPDDYSSSPFDGSVDTFTDENHHIGLGLWKLCELVGAANGTAWIKSGSGAITRSGGQQSTCNAVGDWAGVAIEVELTLSKGATYSAQRERVVAELGERLGL